MEWTEAIGGLLGAAVVVVLESWRKQFVAWRKKVKSREAFAPNLAIGERIKDILHDLRVELGAERCVLYQYENGTNSISGLPFNYGTVYSESHKQQLVPLMPEMQRKPINHIAKMLVNLNNNKMWVCESVTNEDTCKYANTDVVYYQLARGVVSSHHFKLNSKVEDGVLSITFNTLKHPTPHEIERVRIAIVSINYQLSQVKKY